MVPSTAAAGDVIAVERMELYISGFMHVQNDDSIYSISFVILKVLLPSLPNCKILVNEVFTPFDFSDYLSLKDTDKKLGFKFIWYRNGRILVRLRERE